MNWIFGLSGIIIGLIAGISLMLILPTIMEIQLAKIELLLEKVKQNIKESK